ncbi:MAG TPA: MXAN_5187 C-terminal domain-containing protein [Polyangiaceae bacterium]|nr:MXAN_5187 C-terminal domain-containing protein [Polyangiaceae bacterium]
MENAELDVALEELESRLERLRALYEQYFMGIERIEPAIPRKDIDRRIYVLRREKIRNTAKRFKLQTIISRYNTFQQYWQRICREIEAGTYKRHVIRAERIAPGQMLTIAARKRLGRRAFEDLGADAAPAETAQNAAAGAIASSKPPPASVPAPSSVPRPAAAAVAAAPPAKAIPPPKPGARPAKPAPVEPTAARPFESLDLDMDFMGDWDPTTAADRKPKARMPEVPARPFGEALAQPLGAPPTPGAAPRAAPAMPPAGPGRPIPGPGAVMAPKPPIPSPVAAAASAKPVAPAAGAIPPATKLGAAPIARPTAVKPASSAAGALSDDRVRELHARLVEAKRQTQDGNAVSVEGLAKSLKATEAKLREQHKNRKIDFDVVIKDGKAVLKPIVR